MSPIETRVAPNDEPNDKQSVLEYNIMDFYIVIGRKSMCDYALCDTGPVHYAEKADESAGE